ncbi:MAG: O-methyltransferase [Alphaproteobacteria bacterium]
MVDNKRIERFLNEHKNQWNKWNIPFEDGQILYDLALKYGAKNILEIGTSYGHSTIWLAWAVAQLAEGSESLTGVGVAPKGLEGSESLTDVGVAPKGLEGSVLTIEIDHRVMEAARKNFKMAGVLPYILQCQTDAKRFIPHLKGPFDMVFSDGDRSCYIDVFQMVEPLLSPKGIVVTHNVNDHGGSKIADYLKFLEEHPRFKTYFIHSSSEGLAVSEKIA